MNRTFCKVCGSKLTGKKTEFCSSKCKQADKRASIRDEFIRAYGGKCQCPGCDVNIPEFLSLDHIHGGGDKHRKKTGTRGWAMYKLVLDEGCPKDKYRLLCHNCNMSRAHFGYCPHERMKHG